MLSVRRRGNDPSDHFLTLLHLEFACSFNDDPVIAHKLPDTPVPHIDANLFKFFGHPWVAIAAQTQLSVLDRNRTAPPLSPVDGDRHIVAPGATGVWAGWDLNVAFWADGVWMRLVPPPGWTAWSIADAAHTVWNGTAWAAVGGSGGVSFPDAAFEVYDDGDPTKKAMLNLSGISAATTRTFTLPNISSELAILAGT